MTALSLAQSEILDRLRVNSARLDQIADVLSQRLAEIMALREEEAAVRTKNAELWDQWRDLDINGTRNPVELAFDPDEKTIRWNGRECVQLGWIPRNIIHALYFAKKQRMIVTRLERKVWGTKTPTPETVRGTVSQLNKTLAEKNCPYKVKSIKCKQQTIQVENPRTKKIVTKTIRPAIVAYKLEIRKF